MISTLSTSSARAEVVKPELFPSVKKGMIEDKLDWNQWLLISVDTLRAMSQDVAAKEICEKALTTADDKIKAYVATINRVSLLAYELQKMNYEMQIKIFDLENPPWYLSKLFWGSTGLIVGAVLVVVGSVVVASYTR